MRAVQRHIHTSDTQWRNGLGFHRPSAGASIPGRQADTRTVNRLIKERWAYTGERIEVRSHTSGTTIRAVFRAYDNENWEFTPRD